jgi:hypothetical protein
LKCWCREGELDSERSQKTRKLLNIMAAQDSTNAGIEDLRYISGTRDHRMNRSRASAITSSISLGVRLHFTPRAARNSFSVISTPSRIGRTGFWNPIHHKIVWICPHHHGSPFPDTHASSNLEKPGLSPRLSFRSSCSPA